LGEIVGVFVLDGVFFETEIVAEGNLVCLGQQVVAKVEFAVLLQIARRNCGCICGEQNPRFQVLQFEPIYESRPFQRLSLLRQGNRPKLNGATISKRAFGNDRL